MLYENHFVFSKLLSTVKSQHHLITTGDEPASKIMLQKLFLRIGFLMYIEIFIDYRIFVLEHNFIIIVYLVYNK